MKLAHRIALCWRILTTKSCNLMAHAQRELPPSDDPMQALMNRGLQELVLVFSTQGHSGFSASYATASLERLLRFKPLGPLTGEPDEWAEVGPGVYQNKRCSHVFKDAERFNGQAYDIYAVVFREPTGACFTNAKSAKPVTFPYTPTTIYVDVPEAA